MNPAKPFALTPIIYIMSNMSSTFTKPFFITFEGIEGVGKTTQLKYLAEKLYTEGFSVQVTREPGGTPLADDIRQFLLSEHKESLEPEAELLLMFAARLQHIKRVIEPSLESGKIVLCDRFTDTSYAYQGAGRGIATHKIEALEKWVQGSLKPDLVLILDAPVELALSRMNARGKKDRFENEAAEFFKKARDAFLARAKNDPSRYAIIDATRSQEHMHEDIWKCVREKLF
jgi:dTMP kinase